MRGLILLFLLIRSYCSILPKTKTVSPNEVSALHDLYTNTNGIQWGWRNTSIWGPVWNFSTPSTNPCEPQWQGLTCECLTTCVINGLHLDNYNLSGRIPDSIGNLTQLLYLSMSSNAISGTLPFNVGNIKQLYYLALNSNLLSGSIPTSVGSLTQLYELNLYMNRFNGTIPEILCNATMLETLYLFANELVGTIPLCIQTMPNLADLNLYENQLTGPLLDIVPSKMYQFSVYNNNLTGTIPASLVSGSNSSLQYLYLDGNFLEGTMPEIHLPALLALDLDNNQISGTLSESICESGSLNYLDVEFNLFEGPIPECLGGMNLIDQFILGSNQFTGPLPETGVNHTIVHNYIVSSNQLSGTIPMSLCNCMPVELVLGYNHFTGALPECYNVTDMLLYDVSFNYFTGTLPQYLTAMRGLNTVNVYSNLLSGTLPSFSDSPVMGFLYVQNNLFTGAIPLTSALSILRYVDLSNNQFTGTLPEDFFRDHRYLKSFAAASNCITGTLSESICSADSLLFLDLDGLSTASSCRSPIFPGVAGSKSFVLKNQIDGGIPRCLFNMSLLETLHLSGNSIVWSFPTDNRLTISDSLVELSLSHNKLTGTIPDVIQHRQWSTLDLSFNKLTGTLDVAEQETAGASLVLQVNRLSGVIPSSILAMQSINILTGNLFQCDYQRNGLPSQDVAYETYQCGSNSFNQATIAWSILLVVAVTVGCGLWLNRYFVCTDLVEWCKRRWDVLTLYLLVIDESNGGLLEFKTVLIQLRNYMMYLTVIVVLMFLPVYAAVTHYYRTVEYQYAWTVSAAFLSGVVPAVILLVFYVVWVVVLWRVWYRVSKSNSSTVKTSAEAKTNTANNALALRTVQYVVVLLNCVVMVAVNAGYVVVILNYNTQTVFCAQVAIALFKLLWNDFAVRSMFAAARMWYQWMTRNDHDADNTPPLLKENRELQIAEEMPYMTFVVLFNCIIAPCVATATVDSDCFYNIFSPASSVASKFPIYVVRLACDVIGGCAAHTELTYLDVSYDPPYIYSYQCTSSILTNYASVYVLMFLMVAFIKPVGLYLLHWAYARIPKESCLYIFINNSMYDLLKPVSVIESQKSEVLFYKERFVLRLVGKIAVFVTFGVIFPLLAVIACVAFICELYTNLIIVGRFLVEVKESKVESKYREMLSRDCEGCMELLLVPLVRLVVPFAAFFYAFFVFDIYGDEVGFRQAIWAPALLAVTPLLIALAVRLHEMLLRSQNASRQTVSHSQSTELITISVLNKSNSV